MKRIKNMKQQEHAQWRVLLLFSASIFKNFKKYMRA